MKTRSVVKLCAMVLCTPTVLFGQLSTVQADCIAADTTGMSALTSVELAKEMIQGWNVGNSPEATGGETSWGNLLITQTLIDSFKAAGFRSVRLPAARSSHFSNASTFTIDPEWLTRAAEVVNCVVDDALS